MTIYLGADHGGFTIKEQIKTYLLDHGYDVRDCGAFELEPDDDYPQYGQAVAQSVAKDPGSRGVLACRSGHGMVMVANKTAGVRAVLATNRDQTVHSRTNDDANVLSLGVDYLPAADILPLVKLWLDTPFEGGRHQRRIDQINQIDANIGTA